MIWLFAWVLVGSSAGAVPAAPAYYDSLDRSADFLLGPVLMRRLFRGTEPRTLRAFRERHALALIFETHPFATQVARRLRARIRACDVPDAIAVLTRDELDFADLLAGANLGHRAMNFLARHRPRTLAELRALDFAELDVDDGYSQSALSRLRGMIAECDRALVELYQPST